MSKRIIGASRNGGAALATAPILCFVDADMQIHPDSFNAIASAMASPRYVGGATGVTMERWSVGIALTYALILPLVWLTNMDTGVVFMRRNDYLETGGYPEGRHYRRGCGVSLEADQAGPRQEPAHDPAAAEQSHRLDAEIRSLRRLALLLADAGADDRHAGAQAKQQREARDYWYNDR